MNAEHRTPNVECRRRENRQLGILNRQCTNRSRFGVRCSAARRGFTLVEVMMVMTLAFLVFSAMATAMSAAFGLWNDAHARWRLAEVARRTRVIYLDGARNEGMYKGTGFLSADQEVEYLYVGTNYDEAVYRARITYHYPALNRTNEFANLYLGVGGDTNTFDYDGERLTTPYYSHSAYSSAGADVETDTNDVVTITDKEYWYGTDDGTDTNRVRGESIWFADFSVSSEDMPENLYLRRFNPKSELDVDYRTNGEKTYFMSLSYELVFFSGGKQYVHPEHIWTRFVNVHY